MNFDEQYATGNWRWPITINFIKIKNGQPEIILLPISYFFLIDNILPIASCSLPIASRPSFSLPSDLFYISRLNCRN
jgi:hypothetical protein